MFDANASSFSEQFSFNPVDWGEAIKGTKLDLQRLGLGVDEVFPGEPGGRPRVLTVVDRRGLNVKIVRASCDGVFEASIAFPGFGWQDVIGDEHPWIKQSPGLTKREWLWHDQFLGTPMALHHAGLVRPDQLPGQPGMHRTTVVLLKDGTTAPQGSKFQACGPGARSIKRASKSAFTVHVRITEDVAERRLAAWQLSSCEHLLRYTAAIAAMARPAPLWSPPVAVGQQANGNPSRTLPGYMRLVVVNEGLPPQVVRQTPPAPELSLVAVDEGR